MTDTIGMAITTYNSEEAFRKLYESIPFDKLDLVVVVNGGDEYTGNYPNCQWIQHSSRQNIAKARNDGLVAVTAQNIDHIFISEDDMIITDSNIFDKYVNASKSSGLEYLCFASYAWEAGAIGNRTPYMKAEYKDAQGEIVPVSFYRNMCNEFTYRSASLLKDVGLYDEDYQSTFDVDWVYRASRTNKSSSFWYFADLTDADDYIMNNPNVVSRIDPDGNRWEKMKPDYDVFEKKHSVHIPNIPIVSRFEQIEKLKLIRGLR